MAKATLKDLLTDVREMFLQMRIVSGGYGPVIKVLRKSVADVLPKLGRIRRERLPKVIQKRLLVSAKLVDELTLFFPPELTMALRGRLPAVENVAPERRTLILQWWATLPPDDRLLVEAYYRHNPAEVSPAARIAEFTRHHLDLMHLLDREVPVSGSVAAESDETDLSRLILQRVVGDFPEERRVVLETLLIGETGNQQFFVRLMWVVAELEWQLGPKPDWSDFQPPDPMTFRERLVTGAFLLGCLLAIGSVIYAMTR